MARKLMTLTTILLALATALALLRLESLIDHSPNAGFEEAATRTAVERYYAAVNLALLTENFAEIEGVVAVDARIVTADGSWSDRAAFEQRLTELHFERSGLAVSVTRLVAGAGEAVAWLTIASTGAGGSVIVSSTGDSEQLTDRFRVRDGLVVEVIGATAAMSAPSLLVQAALDATRDPLAIGIARLRFDAGSEALRFSSPGPVAIGVETGTLAIQIDGVGLLTKRTAGTESSIGPTVRGDSTQLGERDQIAIPAGIPFRLERETGGVARITLVTVMPVSALAMPSFSNVGLEMQSPGVALAQPEELGIEIDWPDGVSAEALIADSVATLPAGPVQLSIDEAELGSDSAALLVGRVDSRLIVVERGAVIAQAPDDADGSAVGTLLSVAGLDSSSLGTGQPASVRNFAADPATILIVSIESADHAERDMSDPDVQ